MSSIRPSTWGFPKDALLLMALMLWSNVPYRLFVTPDYLLATVWLTAGVLAYLRARQLSPITNRTARVVFWIVGISVLLALWLPAIR